MITTIQADNVFHEQGYRISTDKDLINITLVYEFLDQRSYWGKGITLARLQKAIENSMCFGIYHHDQQCGFARVITDHATFAYLCDVFVLEIYRGKGLSKWLVQNIRQHEELSGLRRWSLATADAHGLYSQYDFVPVSKPELWMEIYTPYQVPGGADEQTEH
jgi:N-acetylglutamate synthase-like GNAT family acetyltransferase